jgi:hypothetical protein
LLRLLLDAGRRACGTVEWRNSGHDCANAGSPLPFAISCDAGDVNAPSHGPSDRADVGRRRSTRTSSLA